MSPVDIDAAETAATPSTDSPSVARATEGHAIVSGDVNASTVTAEASTAHDADATMSEVELLRIENERLKRELTAHVEYRARTDELNAEIKSSVLNVDSAKAAYKKAKERHDDALAELHAFTSGDVQVSIEFGAKDDGKATAGPVDVRPIGAGADHRTVCATWGAWQFGLTRHAIEKADASALRQTEPELRKRKVSAIALGPNLYVPLEQRWFEDGSGYVDAWPLVDLDEWDQRLAEPYAHAVIDLGDEAPDITAKRRAGGEFNGYMVKCGRKRMVVGPDAECVRVIIPPEDKKGGDGGYIASKLFPSQIPTAEVLAFPPSQLKERLATRLKEYVPLQNGFREGLVLALAGDLKCDPEDIVRVAKDNPGRFDVQVAQAGDKSEEVVRLLDDVDATESDAALDADEEMADFQ